MSSSVDWISLKDTTQPLFAGVDVGGTNIKLGLVDDAGRTVGFQSIQTLESRGPEDAIQRIVAGLQALLVQRQATWEMVAAVGLGTPGTMDIPQGMVLEPPNMPHWRFFPLRDRLAAACGKPVAFQNDANAAAFGEYWVGSGRGCSSLILLTLGTGVGGGIIVNGRLLDGTHSFGGECGHIIVDSRDDARCCVWGGGRGELEAYASASAVIERTREALAAGRPSSLRARLEAGAELTPLVISDEAQRGDCLSLEIVLETARYLGIGVTTLVHTVDPDAVVLGGAMTFGGHGTTVGRQFLERVREEFRSRTFQVLVDKTNIDYALLGADAGYIGAAGFARSVYASPTRG